MDFSDAILQINDTNEMHDQNVRADSHLLELAVNDALIYVIKNYPLFNFDDRRLRNAISRINTAFFVVQKQITPHWIWYNRVD